MWASCRIVLVKFCFIYEWNFVKHIIKSSSTSRREKVFPSNAFSMLSIILHSCSIVKCLCLIPSWWFGIRFRFSYHDLECFQTQFAKRLDIVWSNDNSGYDFISLHSLVGFCNVITLLFSTDIPNSTLIRLQNFIIPLRDSC